MPVLELFVSGLHALCEHQLKRGKLKLKANHDQHPHFLTGRAAGRTPRTLLRLELLLYAVRQGGSNGDGVCRGMVTIRARSRAESGGSGGRIRLDPAEC